MLLLNKNIKEIRSILVTHKLKYEFKSMKFGFQLTSNEKLGSSLFGMFVFIKSNLCILLYFK